MGRLVRGRCWVEQVQPWRAVETPHACRRCTLPPTLMLHRHARLSPPLRLPPVACRCRHHLSTSNAGSRRRGRGAERGREGEEAVAEGREVAGGGAGRLERGRKLADVTVAAGEKDQRRPSRQRR
ncbi:hypothetical protein OsI_36341 [Oryza sativa Indica Group]|uniref:Uncharacterized protein n=1 Tax=Oryza sativa subsp. indica TaxID=39946 RepID=B8BKV2_ORYSI|nr:hypothetical protein OsI_36341 [Oryza sativa Indica Group]